MNVTSNKNSCTVKLQNFEGPLDLLYHLIEKNKMSIYDICIDKIADQYLEFISEMEIFDLEIASDFIVMGSSLLHIKSKLLLPDNKQKENDDMQELDPKEELLLKIIYYKKYKEISQIFRQEQEFWEKALYKAPESIEFVFEEEPLKVENLNLKELFLSIITRNKHKRNENSSNDMVKILQYEKVSLRSKIREVIKALLNRVAVGFSEIFLNKGKSKIEIVTGFLAILELAKLKKVELYQKKTFSEIEIRRKDVSIEIPEDEQIIG